MTTYRERLWAAWWMYLATALVIPAALLVFLPINPVVGAIVAVVLYVGCVAMLIAAAPVVSVDDGTFIAGQARVPLEFVGGITAYREPEATIQRGRELDARAWLLIRGWVAPVVKLEITDPEDPTPYWLVSTRNPEKLVEVLERAKGTA